MPGLIQALGSSIPHASSYQELTERSKEQEPPCHSGPLTSEETLALEALTDALRRVADAFAKNAPHYANTPLPQPELRVRPPL